MSEKVEASTVLAELEEARRSGERYKGPTRVVFVVNNDWWFLSHRATWAAAAQAAGAAVTVIAEDTGEADKLRRLGMEFVDIRVGRESSSAYSMAKSALRIFFAILRARPDVVFLTAQAAYTLGWPAALILRRSRFIRVVSGLGRALDTSRRHSLARLVVQSSGRISAKLGNVYTLFQVESDRESFLRLGMLSDEGKALVIPGTGIEANVWQCSDDRDFKKPVVLFASRLFREKGVYEFVEVAHMLAHRGWRFQIAGVPDRGVASTVSDDEIESWRRGGVVEVLGYRTDMVNLLGQATLFVLPTRHREGTPKVLIEAGASGLPCVVSGQPGCSAVVDDGVTGVVLSPEPSAHELASAIESLASDPARASEMGDAARARVQADFSLEAVLSRLLTWEPLGAVLK